MKIPHMVILISALFYGLVVMRPAYNIHEEEYRPTILEVYRVDRVPRTRNEVVIVGSDRRNSMQGDGHVTFYSVLLDFLVTEQW